MTCYNGVLPSSSPSCTSAPLTLPITEIDTYNTMDGVAENGATNTYDSYGNLTSVLLYDYGTTSRGALLTQESIGGCGSVSAVVGLCTSDLLQDASYHNLSLTTPSYDTTTPTATSGLPQHVAVTGSRGQLDSITQCIGYSGSYGCSIGGYLTFTYDDAGEMLTSVDSAGNTTHYTYDTSYDAYQTGVTFPMAGSVTLTTAASYNYDTGSVMSTTATNGNYTTYTYDSMLRPLSASTLDGGVTSWTYNMAGSVSTSTYPTATMSVLHQTGSPITQTSTLDWYGRTKGTSLTDSSGPDLVAYAYDADGNLNSVTNPYRSGGTMYYTTALYDAIGRAKTINRQDCSTSCSQMTYNNVGNTQTITDEGGKQREIFTDGLGRISKVLEPNSSGTLSLETDYLYYQNYTSTRTSTTYQTIVNQKGGSSSSSQWRTRTSTMDMMGRVLSEQTPEASTTTYAYGPMTGSYCAGNVTLPCSRTDARGVVTSYSYDALSRLTGKSYTTTGTTSATTPAITYYYDQSSYNGLSIAYGHGQRTGMSDGSGSTAWSYDTMGRPVAISKTLNGVTEQSNYSYNLDGTVNTLQDFSGVTLTYAYDSTGRQTGVTDASGNAYASGGTYSPASQLTGLTHQLTSTSADYVRSLSYTSRLMPYTISATLNGTTIQSLTYGYPAPGLNNGNISSITNGMDSTRSQSFLYDNVNRLQQAQDASHWGESYTYDNWSNMYQRTRLAGYSGGDNWSVTASAYNQLSNLTYDTAGEVTADQFGNAYTYDAEGRLITAGTGTYVYDGDGYRVEKTVGTTSTLYWPSAVAGIIDESNGAGTSFGKQIYVAGLQVWSEDVSGAGKFLFQDHLGSTRITGDASGNLKDDIDYLPFGETYNNYGTSPSDNHYLFTGYESDDAQSLTEYATFRNLSGSMGRFGRPDPYDGSYDFMNPQSLNRYSYVLNNPLRLIDPTGLILCDYGANADGSEDIEDDDDDAECTNSGGQVWGVDASVLVNADGTGGGMVLLDGPGVSILIDIYAANDPCANAALAAAGTTGQQQLATARGYIAAGEAGGSAAGSAALGGNAITGSLGAFAGSLYGFYEAVHTGGPNDVKNQPGPGYHNQAGIDAGNISFGITCPYGATACQAGAGAAQFVAALFGKASFGSPSTFMDTPSDNASIRIGQAMRAAGCR